MKKFFKENELMIRVILVISTLIVLITLNSCSCEYHMKKMKKNCDYVLQKDTIRIKDTVYVPSVQTDTIFKYFQKDTVIIREGKLTMKYYYNNHDSTIYLSGKCDTLNIIREVPVVVEKEVFKYDFLASNKIFYMLGLLLAILILIVYLFKKK
jgi:hypothetical protein